MSIGKVACVAIAAAIFITAPDDVRAADGTTTGEAWLLIALFFFYLPWLISLHKPGSPAWTLLWRAPPKTRASGDGGPAGTVWKFLSFVSCTISVALAIPFTVLSIIAWLIAWIFTAAARSAVSRHAYDEEMFAELRKQNQLLKEEGSSSDAREEALLIELRKQNQLVAQVQGVLRVAVKVRPDLEQATLRQSRYAKKVAGHGSASWAMHYAITSYLIPLDVGLSRGSHQQDYWGLPSPDAQTLSAEEPRLARLGLGLRAYPTVWP
jgi:hypothetical protein